MDGGDRYRYCHSLGWLRPEYAAHRPGASDDSRGVGERDCQGGGKPRPYPVILSAAKDLGLWPGRSFAALRMTLNGKPREAFALPSLQTIVESGEAFFGQPEGFLFGGNGAFGLGFGDGFQELDDEGAG